MTRIAPIGLLALLGACGPAEMPVPVSGALEFNCTGDAECSLANYVCREGVCVVDEPNPVTVSLHVRPPSDSGLRDQQFHEIRLSESRRLPDLILSNPVTLAGFIKVRNNPLATSIPARVSLLRRGSISGTRQRIEANAADGGGYEMSLLPGLYDISVFPENKRFPPFKEDDFQIKGDTVRDVVLPAPEEYLRVTGRVVAKAGDEAGVADMRVQAFTPQRDRLSTPATTDLDGRFELVLPPTSAMYSVGITPTDANPLHPAVTLDSVLVEGDLDVQDIVLAAEALTPVPIAGVVAGVGVATAIAGATIELRADVGHGVFTWSTAADDTGQYAATVLPGAYTARVVPPAEQDSLAVTHTTFDVAARAADAGPFVMNFEIINRVPLEGVVTDAAREGREGLEIEAVLTGNGDVKGLRRRATTVTGPGGTYSLTLDPGLHDLTVIPPDASGLPRWVWRSEEVRSPTQRNYLLKDSDVISGVLRGPDDKPLPDASVEVYMAQTEGEDAWLIGVGTTDNVGRYTIVLPNP